QLVWQDTDLVFDPAAPVGESLREVYRAALPHLDKQTRWTLAGELLARFHLPERVLWSSPGQLSGGERRRVALARALAVFGYPHPDAISKPTLPRVMILDEPTVGVDVFLQAEIATILLEAQAQLQLTYLVISHDQRFVNRFCTACSIDWPPDLKETLP
ncbi:MAG: hypothetical protein KDA84_01710, partial [Planctomycetaceae bacterium]|nr:hypothetical protein [Planctomycetaceae bacterium]